MRTQLAKPGLAQSTSGMHTPNPLQLLSRDDASQEDQPQGCDTPEAHPGTSDLALLHQRLVSLQSEVANENKLQTSAGYECSRARQHEVMKLIPQISGADAKHSPEFSKESETVLPPPAQHPVPQPSRNRASQLELEGSSAPGHISQGTVGHPMSCAAPCKYVKRKGGCKDGAACSNCHKCFWNKDKKKPQNATEEPKKEAEEAEGTSLTTISVGTLKHPDGCGQACKFVRRKGGCRDGTACPKCHLCQWTRETIKEQESKPTSDPSGMVLKLDEILQQYQPPSPMFIPGISQSVDFMMGTECMPGMPVAPPGLEPIEPLWPSMGSKGHPHSCGAACKYAMKSRGCKDGAQCSRCHLCHWSRYADKTAAKSMSTEGLALALEDFDSRHQYYLDWAVSSLSNDF